MEIRDYLRAIRRLLWLPIVVPLVAAGLTGFLLERQPSQYQADATVIVPAVSAHGYSTSAAAQYIATFKDALVAATVVNAVSQKTGVPVRELTTGLSASTVTTSSNIIHVVFLGSRKQNITQVVREATVDTLDSIAQPPLIQAQNEVNVAQAQLQKADQDITNWTTETGNLLPQQEFNTQQQELDQLLLQLQQAKLANDAARATALQTVISERQTQLATLATQVTQYTALSDARQSALTVRDHAAQQLAAAQALISADQNPSTVTVQDIGRVSKLGEVLKFTGTAYAVALIMALGFILLLELMRENRHRSALVAPGSTQVPPPAPRSDIEAGGTMPPADAAAMGPPPVTANGDGLGHQRSPVQERRADQRLLRRR